MKTEEYHVEGPVMIFLTTTAVDIDEELLNRCLVLTVDESREQTKAIHDLQREGGDLCGAQAQGAKRADFTGTPQCPALAAAAARGQSLRPALDLLE